jgi:hypothetical protein
MPYVDANCHILCTFGYRAGTLFASTPNTLNPNFLNP